MDNAITNSFGYLAPAAGCGTDEVEPATMEDGTDPGECFARNTFRPATEPEFKEGPLWSPPPPDPFVGAFNEDLRLAEDLEKKIADIENEEDALLKGRLAPLQQQQIVACFRAWQLVAEGKVPTSVMDDYALKAGEKAHGNEKIPCSRLMRAIVAANVVKGTKTGQRKRARTSTSASAIDYAIRQGMTESEFTAELERRRKPGERHGIEYLAALGQETRRTPDAKHAKAQIAQRLNGLLDEAGFTVSGDFGGIEPGYHLVFIEVPADTTISKTPGRIIDSIDDALLNRFLQKWVKRTAEAPNGAAPPTREEVDPVALQDLRNIVNEARIL